LRYEVEIGYIEIKGINPILIIEAAQ